MSDGVSIAGADTMLSALIADMTYVGLHTGDPGSAGTSNVSSVTTRESITWGSPSSGSVSASNTPTWSSWAGTNGEVVTDTSYWNASTSGTFEDSIQLGTGVTVYTGDTLELTSVGISFTTAS